MAAMARLAALPLLLSQLPGAAHCRPLLSWVSQPVLPGEVVVLQGSGFSQATEVLLSGLGPAKRNFSLPPLAEGVSGDGAVLRFLLPAPMASYEVAVRDGSGSSNAKGLNVPDVHWVQGDAQETATPGGYVRVFGKAIGFPEVDYVETELDEEPRLEELMESSMDEAELMSAAIATARKRRRRKPAPAVPRLRLKGSGGRELVLEAESGNVSGYQALFRLPADMAPGDYEVFVANGLAPEHFVRVETFLEPSRPLVSTISVRPKEAWSQRRFDVRNYDRNIGRVPRNGEREWRDASPAFRRALADAEAAGGGIVYFPRGQYFLNSSEGFTIPWGVRLLGESRESVALYMSVENSSTAPLAYFRSPGTLNVDPHPQKAGTGRWSVEELTVYVTGYHNYVFLINNRTLGWRMHRCRVHANGYLGSNGPFTQREGFWYNFTMQQPLDIVGLNNCRNWEITENAFFSDNIVLNSQISRLVCSDKDFSGCHGASWGRVADNEIHSGGSPHFMNMWRQVIVERNDMNGASPIAGGSSIGTGPSGGYAQNIYHGENRIRWVHSNDREIVTFDDAGGAYFGPLAKVEGTKVTFANDARSCGSLDLGGWDGAALVVLNGTGVGQWRRVAKAGIGAEKWNAGNRTWILDRPLDIEPGLMEAVVQVVPFRGRIIFHGDRFMDGGTVQFYGQAIDVTLANCESERISGFMAWGQWRGCSEFQYCPNGEFGNGVMPNLQIQYINNTVLEGNKVVRWTAFEEPLGRGFGLAKFLGGASFAVASYRGLPEGLLLAMNVLFRRNHVRSNGGFNLGWVLGEGEGIRDVLLENNVVEKSGAEALVVGRKVRDVFLRGNRF